MYTRTQRQEGQGRQAEYAGADWQALEVQLNRTRVILQEILVHLQEVLRNLKMARTAPGHGASARSSDAAGSRFRAHNAQQARSERGFGSAPGPGRAAGAAGIGGSERHRPGFGTRAGADGHGRTGTEGQARTGAAGQSRFASGQAKSGFGDKARAEGWSCRNGRAGASSSRASAGRERPRSEDAWRAKAGPGASTSQGTGGTEEQSRFRQAGRGGQAGGAATRQAGGARVFRMDQERQRRAREAARKSGMNLKCAYDILCLDYPCSVDEIKVAYRFMARLHHPDLGGDEEAMKDVNVAYELAMRFCAGPRRASAAWAV